MSVTSTPTLFELLDRLVAAQPYTKSKLETILGQPLRQRKENEYFLFLSGEPMRLEDDITIADFDVRIARDNPDHRGFISLSLSGGCVKKRDLDARYRNLARTETPRGGSVDEETTYLDALPGGSMSFGFAERNPDCLSSVTIEFAKEPE